MQSGKIRWLAPVIFLAMTSLCQAWPEWQKSYPKGEFKPWQYANSGSKPDGSVWTDYISPYAIRFENFTSAELLADFADRTRLALGTTKPEWDKAFDLKAYRGSGVGVSWGPELDRSLGAPLTPKEILAGFDSPIWRQQKIIAYALQYQLVQGNPLGSPYQHHHLPQWNPYVTHPSWPWNGGSETLPINWGRKSQDESGQPGPGMDCSDFTSFVYNTALGVQLATGVTSQSNPSTAIKEAPAGFPSPLLIPNSIDPSLRNQRGQNMVNQAAYQALIQTFQPGDLLFLHTDSKITHVVIWIGTQNVLCNGKPAQIPLVINSHNNTPPLWDENGIVPPPGVEVLPFAAESWLYRNYDHALRLLR